MGRAAGPFGVQLRQCLVSGREISRHQDRYLRFFSVARKDLRFQRRIFDWNAAMLHMFSTFECPCQAACAHAFTVLTCSFCTKHFPYLLQLLPFLYTNTAFSALSKPCSDLPTSLFSVPRSCTNKTLHEPTFTLQLLHNQAIFAETNFDTLPISFYTNPLLRKLRLHTRTHTHHLLHQPALRKTSFCTNQLLHKPTFRLTGFYADSLLAPTNIYKNQLSHQPAFSQGNF